jgi:diketogulonate reductase-like aldo/keto reductase
MDTNSTINLHTGSKMPILGLGTWQLTNKTPEAIRQALESGYKMIDTSGDYGTQPGIAEGIKKSDIPRNQLYLVTKVEEDEDAYEATRKNLHELQTDHADLMLIHRPPPTGAGEELWRGLIKAKKDGLTKDIGVSNYSIDQISKLIEATDKAPVVNQIEWSPFGYSAEMYQYCLDNGIVIQAYSPLTRAKRLDDERLQMISEKYEVTPAQLLIRWNLQNGTIPLPKANRTDHQKENLNIFNFEISSSDMDKLFALNEQYSALGNLQYI